MSSLKNLIRREVDRQKEVKIGTVISEPRISDFDGNGSGVWVVDLYLGDEDYLRNVPVKAVRSRFYAQLGQTVAARKSAQGRYEVVGPGNRVMGTRKDKTYDLETRNQQSSANTGFSSERVPFSHYETLDGGAPLGVLWADGVTPFNLVRIVDGDGNPV